MEHIEAILGLIAGAGVGVGIGFFLTRNKIKLSVSDKNKLNSYDSINIEYERSKGKIETLEEQVKEKKSEIISKEQLIDSLKVQVKDIDLAKVKLEAERAALDQKIIEQQEFIKNAQAELKAQFTNISNTHLDESREKFIKTSDEKIGALITPFKDDIEKFKNDIAQKYTNEEKERHSLKNEIQKIVDVNIRMTTSADNLTKALKGDKKIQGNWGELVLEMLLEEAGLVKDIGYTTQESFIDDNGKRQLPDVIIKLPDNKQIIVDSKVSLNAYEKYCAAEMEAEKDLHAKDFINSVKNHISGLSDKNYQSNKNINTLDFVLMFMPIEGTFQLVNTYGADVFKYAWDRKVALTSPSTLFPILKAVHSVWKIETQNKNTSEIIRTATSLYDKFIGFTTDLENIGNHIVKSENAYKEAVSKLKEGKGNILVTVKKLQDYGIDKKSVKKKIPAIIQDIEPEEVEEINEKALQLDVAQEEVA